MYNSLYVEIITGKEDGKGNGPVVSVSAKDLLKQHQRDLQQQKALLSAVPTLGKGLSAGQDVSLDVPLKKTTVKNSTELAKVELLLKFYCLIQ